jgi:hypothetical protein
MAEPDLGRVIRITDDQRMAWPEWERVFGPLREPGEIGTLEHESGRAFKVRLHSYGRDGEDCVFQLEIIDEAQTWRS